MLPCILIGQIELLLQRSFMHSGVIKRTKVLYSISSLPWLHHMWEKMGLSSYIWVLVHCSLLAWTWKFLHPNSRFGGLWWFGCGLFAWKFLHRWFKKKNIKSDDLESTVDMAP